MLATGAVLSYRPMTGYRTGAPTRREILLALLKEEPRTINGLARAIGRDYTTVLHHLPGLEEDGLIAVERHGRGAGSDVRLTKPGRAAAKLMEVLVETTS